MKSRLRTAPPDGAGAVHLSKHEYSKRVLIHQHMMSHYRRLYNAKCDVDTSTPSHFKPRYKPKTRPLISASVLPIQNQLSMNDMRFLENLSSDMNMLWDENGSRHCFLECGEENCVESLLKRDALLGSDKNHCHFPDYQLMPCGVHSSSSSNIMSRPKSAKEAGSRVEVSKKINYSVSSKVREMSVYHPPRKRAVDKSPCKHCTHCTLNTNFTKNEIIKSQKKASEYCDLNAEKVSTVMEIQKEKLQYLQFVQDITQDILQNEMFSNDNLEDICRKHVYLNKEKLEMDKMREQIHKLKEQLGIHKESVMVSRSNEELSSWSNKEDLPSKQRSFEELSFDSENKLRFCPVVQIHETKQLENSGEKYIKYSEKESCSTNKRKCENSEENDIFSLLKFIGFDSSLAEEICLGMNKSENFVENRTTRNKREILDFSGPYEIGEFGGKSDFTHYDGYCHSCSSGKTSKTSDILNVKRENSEKVLRNQDISHNKQNRVKYHSPMRNKVKKISSKESKAGNQKSTRYEDVNNRRILKGNKKLTNSNSDATLDKEDVMQEKIVLSSEDTLSHAPVVENVKSNRIQTQIKTKPPAPPSVVSSPIASDYSSMKDHEESVSEAYSVGEESDEGRESASEVEEDIPDDVSQTTTSSGMTQLTEQFKAVSVNV